VGFAVSAVGGGEGEVVARRQQTAPRRILKETWLN